MASSFDYNIPARINPDRNNCNHGDIFSGSEDHRNIGTQIACYDPSSGRMKFVDNPDDSGSGYLTIPAEVLEHVTDFRKKYACLLNDETVCVNFHISSKDEFVKTILGQVKEQYEFDLVYTYGELDDVFVNRRGSTDGLFLEAPYSWQKIENYFAARSGEKTKMEVKVMLEGEKFSQYKQKYTIGEQKFSWVNAKPTLPDGWVVEIGQSGMGNDSHHFIWKLEGPSNTKQQAKDNVEQFLQGFNREFLVN